MDWIEQEMRDLWSEYWVQFFDKKNKDQKRVDAKQRRKTGEQEEPKNCIKRAKHDKN
jgi:ribosomal protein L13E